MDLPFILNPPFAIAALLLYLLLAILYSNSPLKQLGLFMIFRPLVQPAAILQYSMVSLPIGTVVPLVFIAYTAYHIVRGRYRVLNKELVFLYGFIFFSLPSLLVTPEVVWGIALFVKVLAAMCAFILAFNAIQSWRDIRFIFNTFVVASLIPIAFGFYQYLTVTGHMWAGPYYAGKRIDSVFMAYNAFGEFLSIVLAWLLARYTTPGWGKKTLWLHLFAGAVVLSFFLALNRGSWIALTISILGALVLYPGAIKLRWLTLGGVIISIVAAGFIIDRFNQLDSLDEMGRKRDTFQGRVNGWQASIELVLEKAPLTGMGAGSSREVTEQELGHSFSTHNDYVRTFFESGPFACLCFCFFVVINIAVHRRRRHILEYRNLNYSMCLLAIYYAIVSVSQNIITSATIFPLILLCFGVSAVTERLPKLGAGDVMLEHASAQKKASLRERRR